MLMGETLKITDEEAVRRLSEDCQAMRNDMGTSLAALLTRGLKSHPSGLMLHCEGLKGKRSVGQNAFQWVIFSAIVRDSAQYSDPQLVHDILLMKRYGYRDLTIDGTTIQRLPKTKAFSVHQMADWLSWLLEWCSDNGVKVSMPPEYQQWLEELA